MARDHFKNYNKDLDKDLFAGLLSLYEENVARSQQADAFEKVRTHWYTKGDWNKFAEYVYKNSPFVDRAKFWDFLENPSMAKIERTMLPECSTLYLMITEQILALKEEQLEQNLLKESVCLALDLER